MGVHGNWKIIKNIGKASTGWDSVSLCRVLSSKVSQNKLTAKLFWINSAKY